MKGFTNTTKMRLGHDTSAAGRTVGRVHSFAAGGLVFGARDRITGEHEQPQLTDKGKPAPGGHSAVHREIPSNEMQAEHGGKGELTPGYAKGGKPEKHFHVHHHYHGGKVSKAKMRKMEMGAEHKATGGTIDKLAKGGKGKKWIAGATKNKGALHRALHVPEGEKIPKSKLAKAEHSKNSTMRKRAALAETLGKMHHHAKGGRAQHDDIPEARDPDGYGDYATGGTINPMNAGGAAYGGMATGGTINRMAFGGAAPAQGAMPAMQPRSGANLANLARIAAARGAPMPRPVAGAAPVARMHVPPAPVQPLQMRAKGGGVTMPMQRAAKAAVSEHVGTAAPRGHAGLGKMLRRG
jgi:hypothetical protein